MARSNSSTSTRLIIVIVLSSAFFIAELVGGTDPILMLYHDLSSLTVISVGFRTKSLALIADAFHYVYHTRPIIHDAADWSIAERSDRILRCSGRCKGDQICSMSS